MSKVKFTHNGKEYEMTSEEILAAYRYQEREFLKEDAWNQTKEYLEINYDIDEDDDEEVKRKIEEAYDGTVEEYIEYVVSEYEWKRDMNVDFNSTFQYIIESIFE